MYWVHPRWLHCVVNMDLHSPMVTFFKLGWVEDCPLSWSLDQFMMLISGS